MKAFPKLSPSDLSPSLSTEYFPQILHGQSNSSCSLHKINHLHPRSPNLWLSEHGEWRSQASSLIKQERGNQLAYASLPQGSLPSIPCPSPPPVVTIFLLLSTAFLCPKGLSQGTREAVAGHKQKPSVTCQRYTKGNQKSSVK